MATIIKHICPISKQLIKEEIVELHPMEHFMMQMEGQLQEDENGEEYFEYPSPEIHSDIQEKYKGKFVFIEVDDFPERGFPEETGNTVTVTTEEAVKMRYLEAIREGADEEEAQEWSKKTVNWNFILEEDLRWALESIGKNYNEEILVK